MGKQARNRKLKKEENLSKKDHRLLDQPSAGILKYWRNSVINRKNNYKRTNEQKRNEK